jgi:hypothetical protein
LILQLVPIGNGKRERAALCGPLRARMA